MDIGQFGATIFLTGGFALMVAVLGFIVSLRRTGLGGISFGDAGDPSLQRRVRAHGNFIEYAPLAVMTVLSLNLADAPDWAAWGAAGVFLATRILHAAGLLAGMVIPRAAAMVAQHLTFIAAGFWLLAVAIGWA